MEQGITSERIIVARPVSNRRWLQESMNPYFFISMKDERDALAILEREMGTLRYNRRLILADREKSLILALANRPGTLYETLLRLQEREISYAMITHSTAEMPGTSELLEIQRFEFDRRSNAEIQARPDQPVPPAIRKKILAELKRAYHGFDLGDFDRLLDLLWLNNPSYTRISPPERVARIINLFQQVNRRGGLHLEVEPTSGSESRVIFGVANPPQSDFLLQVMEVFHRLDLGVNRAYCLTVSNGIHPFFLGTFYVHRRDGSGLRTDDPLFARLQQELYNTQILATFSKTYRELVVTGVMNGEEASLVNAFISFCHTSLAHHQPDRFGLEEVRGAFHTYPQLAFQLVKLFRLRFDPDLAERERAYAEALPETELAISQFNTGHRYLDDIRRTIFRTALLLIRHTLKTNFYVLEKQALAFRLDPAYLADLGPSVTGDLPAAQPFRVTFFFSRHGSGYHIGFSDIARGGWRTVIARTRDDYVTNANNLFRENFVLAHTQHLKNKDIYEGGSKMVVILDASDLRGSHQEQETWRLYKLQYGITNAFLDIFTTETSGVARHPKVVDYLRQEEPIELGPDENMHNSMIEAIARRSVARGYLLGAGIMSSKRVGINHKEYGVTSTGVMTFAEIVMRELGIDIRRDPFRVKITGGPNGDVAGNFLKLLLQRSPLAKIGLILDGTAALFDPDGADHHALSTILLKKDLDAFDPAALHPGGFILYRSGSRIESMKELYRKITRTGTGLKEEWLSTDQFSRIYGLLPFTVPAELFVPAGGRPETIDAVNAGSFFLPDGNPSARVIVEGANSFLTPEARVILQKRGVMVMRDASANKCGVISSSYEVIANLLLSEKEFLAEKERYVGNVLEILEKRAGDEARLIMKRRREQPGLLCTEISDALSGEINERYARLFVFFQKRPELCQVPLFRRAILAHLPRMIREESRLKRRIPLLPQKYLAAMLAAEIASSMVYREDRQAEFEDTIRLHLIRNFTD